MNFILFVVIGAGVLTVLEFALIGGVLVHLH